MKRRNVLPCTGGGGRAQQAFTMAEILLSLTIIGVVAAITLPSLTGNINERTWNTQRKALFARFSQAIALMPALNGYGTIDDTTDTAAETFVTAGLSKVLKINNICDSEHLEDCGLPSKIIPTDGGTLNGGPIDIDSIKTLSEFYPLTNNAGSSIDYPVADTKAAAFETVNGESILVYYNPNCRTGLLNETAITAIAPMMCANFVYDLNGSKGPNTVGKDIGFLTAFYSSDSQVVAPIPAVRDITGAMPLHTASAKCRELDEGMRLPNLEELMSIFYNKRLVAFAANNTHYWSATSVSSTKNWGVVYTGLYANVYDKTLNNYVRCVKR